MLRNRASQEAQEVKNPPANAGDARDAGSILGLGRSSGGRNATPVFLACKIPCTEEPSRLQSLGSQRVGHDCASEHTGMRNRRIDRYHRYPLLEAAVRMCLAHSHKQ